MLKVSYLVRYVHDWPKYSPLSVYLSPFPRTDGTIFWDFSTDLDKANKFDKKEDAIIQLTEYCQFINKIKGTNDNQLRKYQLVELSGKSIDIYHSKNV